MKNLNELRDILGIEIDNLRDGKVDAKNVNAIVSATGKILNTIKLEMEYMKLTGRRVKMKFIESSLEDDEVKK